MPKITIKDIYTGMPDAKDEINTDQSEMFFKSFVVPPRLPIEELLDGKKFLISGFKGTGKTSVLYYLQHQIHETNNSACTSFLCFKSDYEEVRRSNLECVARKLTAYVDISGEIQPNKIEYLHLWRWIFFKKIVDDCEEHQKEIFVKNSFWHDFVREVNKISFSSGDKKVISLSSLSVSLQSSASSGVSASTMATFEVAKSDNAFQKLVEIVDQCEVLFKKLDRTNIPYYLFVDEIEAYYGDKDIFCRDLTLIRDLIFTVHRINGYRKIQVIAAVRNEIIYAMDRFIQTRELNKITDGFCVPIKWSYGNTNAVEHPIIQILMKRINVASNGEIQRFSDWFPEYIRGKSTVNYILDNGWNKPRDIVRLLIAAKNDALHNMDSSFSQATFDTLRKEYSKNSLAEIRQELQSLYTSEEIEMVLRLLRGGPRIISADQIYKNTQKGSKARTFWLERRESVLEDFYRVGFWGNVNRELGEYKWRWQHRDDTDVLLTNGWELAIHSALCSELSIMS